MSKWENSFYKLYIAIGLNFIRGNMKTLVSFLSLKVTQENTR